MNERSRRVLEYDKIKNQLAHFATSSLGKDKCLNLMPTTEEDWIIHALNETTEAVKMIQEVSQPPLGPIYDLKASFRIAQIGGMLTPKQLLEVGDSLRTARVLKKFITSSADKEERFPILFQMGSQLHTQINLEKEIERCIISETDLSDHASPELNKIRKQIAKKNSAIRQKLESMVTSTHYQKFLQDTIITMRDDRFVLPVKSEHKNQIKGMVHDQSSKGSTFYIEPIAVVELNNDVKLLKIDEQREIEKILRALTEQVAQDAEGMKMNIELLGHFDFVLAKAKYSISMQAIQPEMNKKLSFRFKNARHPLLPRDEVVPSNIWLGKDFTTLLITGPNTGGKTVTLKTVGLLTLMAQSGLHIPADYGTEVAIFNEIFADIGDEQSIEQSLSTFSSHMTNIVQILKEVTPYSLILFDELGAGTDPTEGAALAMAILDQLKHRGVRTLATTHYSELKAYAISETGIENACVEFDIETLSPTYRLLIGVPGKSNAFEISKKLGLEEKIIEASKTYIHQESIAFEDIVTQIESSRKIAEKERDEAIKLRLEVEKIKSELHSKEKKWLDQKDELMKKAKDQAKSILKKAKDESDEIIRELRKIDKKDASKKNKEIEAMRQKLQRELVSNTDRVIHADVESELPPETVSVGDRVMVVTIGQEGTVLTEKNDKGEVSVQVGLMKMNVNIKKLLMISTYQQEQKVYQKHVEKRKTSATISIEIDVRGENLEDAINQVDKYLDDAALSNLPKVRIIHGKGTGILRKGLHAHFKKHPHVKSYAEAAYNEGGSGATVVELK